MVGQAGDYLDIFFLAKANPSCYLATAFVLLVMLLDFDRTKISNIYVILIISFKIIKLLRGASLTVRIP